jgi:hypothetical protein
VQIAESKGGTSCPLLAPQLQENLLNEADLCYSSDWLIGSRLEARQWHDIDFSEKEFEAPDGQNWSSAEQVVFGFLFFGFGMARPNKFGSKLINLKKLWSKFGTRVDKLDQIDRTKNGLFTIKPKTRTCAFLFLKRPNGDYPSFILLSDMTYANFSIIKFEHMHP